VPEGRRLVTLDAKKVAGLELLAFGDRFDLVMSEPIDKKVLDEAERVLESQGGANFAQRAKLVELRETTRQKVLVVNGMMIEPPDKASTARDVRAAVAVRPEEVADVEIEREGDEMWLPRVLVAAGLTSSSSEAVRLIKQGAVQVNGEKVTDKDHRVRTNGPALIQRGKRRYARVHFR